MNATAQQTGIVKWFNKTMGFGFLGVAPSLKQEFGIPMEKDLFFHADDVVGEFPRVLEPEQKVSFDVRQTGKGPRAILVTAIK